MPAALAAASGHATKAGDSPPLLLPLLLGAMRQYGRCPGVPVRRRAKAAAASNVAANASPLLLLLLLLLLVLRLRHAPHQLPREVQDR